MLPTCVLTCSHSVKESECFCRLPPAASEAFISHHNRFTDWKSTCVDGVQRRVLSKAPGLLARLGCVFAALRQALKIVVYHEDLDVVAWGMDISLEDVECAANVLNHCICSKFVLQMTQPPVEIPRMFSNTSSRRASDISPFIRNCTDLIPVSMGVNFVNGPAVFPSPIQVQNQRELPHALHNNWPNASTVDNFPGMQTTLHGGASSSSQLTSRTNNGQINHKSPSPLSTPEITEADDPDLALQVVSVKSENHDSQHSSQTSFSPPEGTPRTSVTVDIGEMSFSQVQAAMEQNTPDAMHLFVTTCGRQLKRLLEYRGKLTPSVMSQRHLMPSLTKDEADMRQSGNRFPVTLALQFLHVVSFLGFGEVGQQNLSNNRRSTYFYKKLYFDLTQSQKELLHTIGVSPEAYMESFNEVEESQSASQQTSNAV